MRSLFVTSLLLFALAPTARADWTSQVAGNQDLYDIWGSGPNDLYAVGAAGAIYHSTNAGKDWRPEQSGVQEPLYTVWGSGPDNVYAAGDNGTILRSTDQGKTWALLKSPQLVAYRAMEGFGAKDIYLVGDNGTILHSTDGISFNPQKSGINTALQSIWGASASQVYTVGDNGTILQTTNGGTTWTPLVSGTNEILRGIWGTGTNNIFAVGYKTTILQSTDAGKTWKTVQSGGVEWLGCVWGSSANDIFAVGAKGLLLRSRDGGKTFSPEKSTSTSPLYAVWGASELLVRIVGRNGSLLKLKLPDPIVTIEAKTPGAVIVIDNEEQSGAIVTKTLTPGSHTILVKKPTKFFEDYTAVINVDEGETPTFSYENAPEKLYSLTIPDPSEAKGAAVFFDGELKGKTPLTIENILAGRYELIIRAAGFDDDKQFIEVNGNTLVYQPNLQRTVEPIPDWAKPVAFKRDAKIALATGGVFWTTAGVLFAVNRFGDHEVPFQGDTASSVAKALDQKNSINQLGFGIALAGDASFVAAAGAFWLSSDKAQEKFAARQARKSKKSPTP